MGLSSEEVYALLNKKIKEGGATAEQIETAIDNYLDRNPEYIGATTEQALQIEQNATDIEQIKQNMESVPEIKDNEVSNVDTWSSQKINEQINGYTETYFKNFFAMQRTGKKYTVRYPLWETSHVSTGEKLDDNLGLVIEASTTTTRGQDDYENIPLFKTYDVNADIHYGKIRILSIKGDSNFNDNEVDTFVLGMPYYEKVWFDEQYMYLSRSDSPLEGYTLCAESKYANGSKKEFCVYAKYQAGRNSNNILGSFKNKKPQRNMSHNNNITEEQRRGDGSVFGMSCDIQYLQNTFLIKYADKNFNTKLGGCLNYNYQYNASVAEENTKRVILTNAQADAFVIGSTVSVGELGGDTNKDRGNNKVHNICDSVIVKAIEVVDSEHKAVVLNVENTFTTTTTTVISSMHWTSGYSDRILGRDGCLCESTSQISSLKYPSVLQGIEIFVGGYEVLGNAFMDLVDDHIRDVYVCNDESKLTTNVTTAKSTYYKIPKQMHFVTSGAWNYITEMHFDIEHGINIVTEAGTSGSGSGTGYCDGFYDDAGVSGQREFLLLGYLGNGTYGGLFCVHGGFSLTIARWSILARVSFNGLRGELTSVA